MDINIQLLGVALTKRFSVSKVITGAQGLQGCIVRVTQWAKDVNYRNDSALTSGERYIDIVVHRISNVTRRFKAKAAHNGVTSSSSNEPNNSTYWEELNTLSPIYTPLILADYAVIEFFQGHEIKIMKTDGTVGAGISGTGSGTTGVRFWAGGATPGTAPFRVNEAGDVYANNGIFKGSSATPFSSSYTIETVSPTLKRTYLSFNSGFNFSLGVPDLGTTLEVYLPTDLSYSGVDCWLCVPYLTKSGGSAVVKVNGGLSNIVSIDNYGIPTFMSSKEIFWVLHLKAIQFNGVLYWFIINQ